MATKIGNISGGGGVGPTGPTGASGATGASGGLPPGGAPGTVLMKQSSADGDADWLPADTIIDP